MRTWPSNGLRTEPDFSEVGYDDKVTIWSAAAVAPSADSKPIHADKLAEVVADLMNRVAALESFPD